MQLVTTIKSFFGSLAFLCLVGTAAMPARAATEAAARVVKYSKEDIVPVRAKLRFSTLIVLPEDEEILDFASRHGRACVTLDHDFHGIWRSPSFRLRQ